MEDRKRRKPESDESEEEKKSIDWAREYLKLQKCKQKEAVDMQKEFVDMQNKFFDMQKEFVDMQKKKDEELREINVKFHEIAVKNKELQKDMAIANTELLKVPERLSARGAIELLESQKFSSAPPYCTSRQLKYEWLYKNSKTFASNVRKYFDVNMSEKDVGTLAKNLYASASHDIHTGFNYGSEVIVHRNNYQRDQLKLLEAICETLNVKIRKM